MKALSLVLAGVSLVMVSAVPAHAGGVRLRPLLMATAEDYQTITSCFKGEKEHGRPAWNDYRGEVGAVIARLTTRRKVLAYMDRDGGDALPPGRRGLLRMLIRDLDEINLSMLALVMDEHGLCRYLKTGDRDLVAGIAYWQNGIRLAIRQTGRCINMAGYITGPPLLRRGPWGVQGARSYPRPLAQLRANLGNTAPR